MKSFGVSLLAVGLCAQISSVCAHDEVRSRFSTTFGSAVMLEAGVQRGLNINGKAMMVRSSTGKTQVYSFFMGLLPNTMYGSHVHSLPCSFGGGGHYKTDPSIATMEPSNEILPMLATDGSGVARGFAEISLVARPDAQSVVVHDTDGAKIACVDLLESQVRFSASSGQFSNLAGASTLGLNIDGNARLVRYSDRSIAKIEVAGLQPSTAYMAHVHNLPCSLNGGAHYKINPLEASTVASNEIWLELSSDALGAGEAFTSVAHAARPDAESIVIHAPGGAKVACADLRSQPSARVISGELATTAAGLAKSFSISGLVTMVRKLDGSTQVSVSAKGLSATKTYPAHVHDRPCSTGGGAHYKIDPSMAATEMDNEIWLSLVPVRSRQAMSVGSVAVKHLARPEAQSVVIHDPADGARIACADLR